MLLRRARLQRIEHRLDRQPAIDQGIGQFIEDDDIVGGVAQFLRASRPACGGEGAIFLDVVGLPRKTVAERDDLDADLLAPPAPRPICRCSP